MTNDLLINLQRIEVGLETTLRKDIIIWDGNYISGKNKVSNFKEIFNSCQICKISEPLIWHHVYTKNIKYKTSTCGTTKRTDIGNLLGLVKICPNCHYRIHSMNPFNKGSV